MTDLGQGLTGINTNTAEYFLLDSGIAYIGIDETKLALNVEDTVDQAIAGALSLGATAEGSTFDSGKEMHDIELNGRRYPTRNLKRIDGYAPTLTLTLAEHSEANLKRMLSHYTLTTHPKFIEIEPSLVVEDTDYLTNVALLGKLSGKETPILIVLRNVLVVNSFGLELGDKAEAMTETQWLAHATLTAPHDPPYAIYYPGDAAS